MAQRSRKRGRRKPAARSRPTQTAGAPRTPRPSAEQRNAAVRASLAPLSPGERPWPLKVAVAVAVVLGVANLILFIAGAKPHVGGQKPHLPEILVFSGLMLACAGGMWTLRYWAVLGFQTLLAIGVLGFCLALVRVSSLVWGAVCVVVIAAGGYLFYKLVRVLSRLQLPTPPGR
ncbi:MAG: hypothetical protein ACJ76X_14035 [Solirubrobacteraceae bacterium]